MKDKNESFVFHKVRNPVPQRNGLIPATSKLVKKLNKNTDKKEWALVSRKDPKKILKWFGPEKPSEDEVQKEEKRVNYWKHQVKSNLDKDIQLYLYSLGFSQEEIAEAITSL